MLLNSISPKRKIYDRVDNEKDTSGMSFQMRNYKSTEQKDTVPNIYSLVSSKY